MTTANTHASQAEDAAAHAFIERWQHNRASELATLATMKKSSMKL